MKDGPHIAQLGALIGDPARANMLLALMSGKALTASELAGEAGITQQTASSHLAKLEAGGLIERSKQGRHRYFSLHGPEVGVMLENMMGLAAQKSHLRTRTGPRDPALRKARICYDHLAGEYGVMLYEHLVRQNFLKLEPEELRLTRKGHAFFVELGLDVAALQKLRRPLCRACLDWSARRNHLAGALGAAFLTHIIQHGWARRIENSRVIDFSKKGDARFKKLIQP